MRRRQSHADTTKSAQANLARDQDKVEVEELPGASTFGRRLGQRIFEHKPLVAVFLATALWNLVLWLHAEPNVFPDGITYGMLGAEMLEGKFSNDLYAFRTPGFPAFLAAIFAVAGKENWQAVINVQFLLGTFVPVALYFLFLPIAKRKWIAAVGAAAYLLDRYFLALQAVPLTELLGGVLAAFVLAWHVWAWRRASWREALALGFLTAYWILVRPSFQLLPWALALTGVAFGLWEIRKGVMQLNPLLRWHAAYLAAYYVPLVLWSAHIYAITGHWGLSHQLGASLTNHTGAFMEYAPDSYGPLKEIYVAEKQRRGGNWINVFDAIYPELTSATKWRRAEISLAYKEIDKYLLGRFWRQYLLNVKFAWMRLWDEPSIYLVDWSATEIDPTSSAPVPVKLLRFLRFTPIWAVVYKPLDKSYWRDLDTVGKTPYILLILGIVIGFLRRRDSHALLSLCFVLGAVVYHMLIHAAIQLTEFGRYRLPVQPLWWGFLWCATFTLCSELFSVFRTTFREVAGVINPAKSAGPKQTTPSRKRSRI